MLITIVPPALVLVSVFISYDAIAVLLVVL
jgi:hypothetical protein